jgi:acetyltransferase-like isoleucine patch superfamily enzyme
MRILGHVPDRTSFRELEDFLASRLDDQRARYARLQLVAAQAHATLDPPESFSESELQAGSINPGQSRARLFLAKGAALSRLTISGAGDVNVWIGAGAKVSSVTINLVRSGLDLIFGPYCEFSSSLIQATAGDGAIVVGAGTTISKGNFYLSEGSTTIAMGDDCMFSNDVAIRTSDSHAIFDLETGLRFNQSSSVVIQEHCWISRKASLNKGVRIGPDVVLGQESVASGQLRANSVYAGNPAKPVRSNITWDRTHAQTLDEARIVKPDRTRQRNFLAAVEAIRNRSFPELAGKDELDQICDILASFREQASSPPVGKLALDAMTLRDTLRANRY